MKHEDLEKIANTIAWKSFGLHTFSLAHRLKIVALLVNERRTWERLENIRLERERAEWEKEFHERTFCFEWTCKHCDQICTFSGVSLTKGGELIVKEEELKVMVDIRIKIRDAIVDFKIRSGKEPNVIYLGQVEHAAIMAWHEVDTYEPGKPNKKLVDFMGMKIHKISDQNSHLGVGLTDG